MEGPYRAGLSLQSVLRSGVRHRKPDHPLLPREFRGHFSDVFQAEGQWPQDPPALSPSQTPQARHSRNPDDQMEFHQIPDRPRWPTGGALRAADQARGTGRANQEVALSLDADRIARPGMTIGVQAAEVAPILGASSE